MAPRGVNVYTSDWKATGNNIQVPQYELTATDMRGTAVIGAEREIGALEYDPALKIEGGGGANPMRGKLG